MKGYKGFKKGLVCKEKQYFEADRKFICLEKDKEFVYTFMYFL